MTFLPVLRLASAVLAKLESSTPQSGMHCSVMNLGRRLNDTTRKLSQYQLSLVAQKMPSFGRRWQSIGGECMPPEKAPTRKHGAKCTSFSKQSPTIIEKK